MTAPDQPTQPTVLRFRSASGRTEIAQRPDGTVSLHVLHGSDVLTVEELTKAAWALGEAAPVPVPMSDEELAEFKAKFTEAMGRPSRMVVLPQTEDEALERAESTLAEVRKLAAGWIADGPGGAPKTLAERILALVSEPAVRCCDLHGRNCEQGGEECCWQCTEAHHFKIGHGGVPCPAPDLSGDGLGPTGDGG